MSWLFSQALVEEYLGGISSDGEQSVQLSGNLTQQAYCAPDKMTEFSRLSQFGMMFKPLTEDRGKELLMSYLAAFHAKTSPQQEKAQESTESDQGCGEKWRGSFTKYDPDSSSWKTHQCSLLGDLEPFSETWPRWGLMRNGECWEQQMSERHTNETEFGLKQTPPLYRWTTPTAHMSKETNAPSEHMRNTPTLTAQVNWPTPRTKGMCGGTGSWELLKKNTSIEEARQMGAGNGGKLNPMWVEWLMGWPLGWTDLKPLEMDKFQKWLDEHGKV
jgi:hypothetical protein